MKNSNESKKTKIPESNLEKVVGGVQTGWRACDRYRPVGGKHKEGLSKICGTCIYCDKYVDGGVIITEEANCHYPDPVTLIQYCNSID